MDPWASKAAAQSALSSRAFIIHTWRIACYECDCHIPTPDCSTRFDSGRVLMFGNRRRGTSQWSRKLKKRLLLAADYASLRQILDVTFWYRAPNPHCIRARVRRFYYWSSYHPCAGKRCLNAAGAIGTAGAGCRGFEHRGRQGGGSAAEGVSLISPMLR